MPQLFHTKTMYRAARFLFVGFVFLLFFFVSQTKVSAQTYTTDADPNVPHTLHNYTQTVFIEVFSTIGCQLIGIDLANSKEPCLGLNSQTGKIGYVQSGGLIGFTSDMMVALYTPPAHASDFTRYLGQNFGIARPTYAQGVGFTSINPLLNIWKIFRNIVYLFFIIIFVIVGFAIMLRVQIDPRTVMSIENQLPKLILGLILVTFSFAIAGLLIDGMWILTFLIINILTPHLQGVSAATVNGNLFENPFGFYNNIASGSKGFSGGIIGVAAGAAGSTGDLIRSLLSADASHRLGLIPPQSDEICSNGTFFLGWFADRFCQTGQVVGNSIAGAVGFVVSWLISIVALVVVLIAILVALFRVWFMLLLAYFYILLDIVLAPFYILFGMIPGSKITFTAWLRDITANLIAFPAVVGVFLLGRLFMESFIVAGGSTGGTERTFVPPLIGNPLSGEYTTNPLGWLLGLAVVLVAPGIVNQMKELFQAPQNKLGAAAFQNLGMGGKAFGGLAKNIFGTIAGQEITYTKDGQIRPIENLPGKAFARFRKAFGGS